MTYKEKLKIAYDKYCLGLKMSMISHEIGISVNTLYSESYKGQWKIKRYLRNNR